MMFRRNARKLAVLVLAVAGCASTPSRFYALQSIASSSDGAIVRDAVIVGPISIPASVDRPELVVQVAENQVKVEEFDRWVKPEEMIGDGRV